MTNFFGGKNRGFSMIELMVAMVVGLILIVGVSQIFVGNRQAQRMEQSVSRIEENGRIAMDLITQDMRLAGFYGCSRSIKNEIANSSIFVVKASPTSFSVPVSSDFVTNSIRGFQNVGNLWSPTLPTDLNTGLIPSAKPNSDLVAIYYGQPSVSSKLTGNISGTMDITANSSLSIAQNSQILVGNCAVTDLITVTNAPGSGSPLTIKHEATGNTSASLSATSIKPYGTDSKISQFVEHVYFVKDTGRFAPNGNDHIFSLYRRDNSASPPQSQELVEGIEFLHILYGEQLANGNIQYVSANNVGQWANVVSVQIGVLAQSFDSVRDNDDTVIKYQLLDRQIDGSTTAIQHSGGRSLRRVYNATIELRNRME